MPVRAGPPPHRLRPRAGASWARGAGAWATCGGTNGATPLAIFGACAFAAWGLDRLGYRITVAVVMLFLLGVLERKGDRHSPLVITVVVAWGSFLLFDTVLRVPLPRGPFGL